jgi:hypothetical protein
MHVLLKCIRAMAVCTDCKKGRRRKNLYNDNRRGGRAKCNSELFSVYRCDPLFDDRCSEHDVIVVRWHPACHVVTWLVLTTRLIRFAVDVARVKSTGIPPGGFPVGLITRWYTRPLSTRLPSAGSRSRVPPARPRAVEAVDLNRFRLGIGRSSPSSSRRARIRASPKRGPTMGSVTWISRVACNSKRLLITLCT